MEKTSNTTSLPACVTCPYLDDIDKNYKTHQLDVIYCTQVDEPFERRMKPFKCPYSKFVKEKK